MAKGIEPMLYTWDWGDGNSSTGPSPTHVFSIPGYYNICQTITDAAVCVSTYCDSSTYLSITGASTMVNISVIPVVIITGNDEIPASMGTAYPNPVHSLLRLESSYGEITSVEIFDLDGRIILKRNYSGKNRVEDMDVASLANGLYLVRAYTNDGSVNLKFQKN
jgi:hypothetical protein